MGYLIVMWTGIIVVLAVLAGLLAEIHRVVRQIRDRLPKANE